MLESHCNRRFRTTLNPDILMQVTLRRYLDGAIRIPGEHPTHGGPIWVFKDGGGFEVWPWIGTPLKLSFAHKIRGQEMTTGYTPDLYYPIDQVRDFNKSDCNILVESWAWNCAKGNFEIPESVLLARFDDLRTGPDAKQFWEIPSIDNLQDESKTRIIVEAQTPE